MAMRKAPPAAARITRRSFVTLPFAHAAVSRAASSRPNVIVILVDDMGFSDLGCYGSEIPTPNIESSPPTACASPSSTTRRAAALPRRASHRPLSHQAGIGHLDPYIRQGSQGYTGKLSERCLTLGEVLGDAGYAASMTGKWHLGLQNGTPPWQRGFARSLCSPYGELLFPGQTSPRINNARLQLFHNGKEIPTDSGAVGNNWYRPRPMDNVCAQVYRSGPRREKAVLSLSGPQCASLPTDGPRRRDIARFRGKYKAGWDQLRRERHARQKEMGLLKPEWALSERPPDSPAWESLTEEQKDRFDHLMALYAAIISRVDKSVGDLVAGLYKRGVLDNTLILFMSDNGGNAESGPDGRIVGGPVGTASSFIHLGMNWATLNNTPFRRYKHFTHEGAGRSADRPLARGNPDLPARPIHSPAGAPSGRYAHRAIGNLC